MAVRQLKAETQSTERWKETNVGSLDTVLMLGYGLLRLQLRPEQHANF